MENNKYLQKERVSWPTSPGVYTFWSKNKRIYVGKAVNLRSRLSSYFQVNLNLKTSKMVSVADKIDYILVNSELEALLLESDLIKKYKPKYNILLKDDKHPLYIGITNDYYPRVVTVRRKVVGLKKIYGPFPSALKVRYILKMLRKIFPFSDHKLGKKACFYSHIGLCNPCPNQIQMTNDKLQILNLTKNYRKNIRNINLVLSRKFNFVRKSLEKEMNYLTKIENYEMAKVIRDKIAVFDYITQKKTFEENYLEDPNLVEDKLNVQLNKLKEILKINRLNRIECFDISHLSGSLTTASMVVFINGMKETSLYRHFRIRQVKKSSDYDSLRETAIRRYKHLADWGIPDLIIVDGGLGQVNVFKKVFDEEPTTDLDRPQKTGIIIAGIAKNPDRLVLTNGVKININKYNLTLVENLRDEAHRFARRYHHKLVTKKLFS